MANTKCRLRYRLLFKLEEADLEPGRLGEAVPQVAQLVLVQVEVQHRQAIQTMVRQLDNLQPLLLG